MIWAFDLDGTLADTRTAVEESYRRAGAAMPPDAWGRPAHTWLCPPAYTEEEAARIHRAKNLHYLQAIREGRVAPLPALDLLGRALGGEDDVVAVLTGASKEAATALLHHWSLWPQFLLCSMTGDAKLAWLRKCPEPGVWVDDDVAFVERVRKETAWRTISAQSLSSPQQGSVLDGAELQRLLQP